MGRARSFLTASRAAASAWLIALFASAGAGIAADNTGGLLPVPAHTIERGERITAAMLSEKHFYYDPSRPISVITDPQSAIGKAARRTLAAGQPIPKTAFRAVRLVSRGKPTEARFRMGNLTISATVLPTADGGPGDIVQARNLDSGRTITGVVAMDGTIEVSAP